LLICPSPYSPSDCDIRISGGGNKFSHSEIFLGLKIPARKNKNESILGLMMKCFRTVRYKVTEKIF